MKFEQPPQATIDATREAMHRQMLSAVSHDLKTPLSTIIGSLEIYTRMESRLTPEKKRSLMQSALSEAYRLDNFVTNILDMAKLEGQMVRVKEEKTDVFTIIKDSITKLGPKADKAKISITTPARSIFIYTDPMLLGRAIGIVIDNAIKYAGKDAMVTIECSADNGIVSIIVRDNGQGIPADKIEDIFLKHTRFAKTDLQNAGTGLGLAICRLIMELLSGSVTAKNTASGGAEFTLRLPA